MRLETVLRTEAPAVPVRVSTVAGVLKGSPRVSMPLANLVLPWSIRHDLRYQGPTADYLQEQCTQPLAEGVVRVYEFFASRDDLFVPPDSALPTDLQGEKVCLRRRGHGSLVRAVARQQIEESVAWFGRL